MRAGGSSSKGSTSATGPSPGRLSATSPTTVSDRTGAQVTASPEHARFDYQFGGAYPHPDGVRIVSRDSTASPAAGLYNICYVNAFQVQPGTDDWRQKNHPDLLLRGRRAGTGRIRLDRRLCRQGLPGHRAGRRATA
ncbi:endo alpha-1,4 polygalactosaminidase [Catenulispora sp. GAS73]|uniref:endo alpha-1,4 polygalactosaminidase n=1 Tax=Catenulispora sp. GAS73 TaxID=3156269 RepID=UPI003511560E